MSDTFDDENIPNRLMADPELAAPEIDDVEGDPLSEAPGHPERPAG